MLSRRLAANPELDPANDTSLDPTPDLLAALSLYPKRAEPLMVLSRYSEWLRDHWCAPTIPCHVRHVLPCLHWHPPELPVREIRHELERWQCRPDMQETIPCWSVQPASVCPYIWLLGRQPVPLHALCP